MKFSSMNKEYVHMFVYARPIMYIERGKVYLRLELVFYIPLLSVRTPRPYAYTHAHTYTRFPFFFFILSGLDQYMGRDDWM